MFSDHGFVLNTLTCTEISYWTPALGSVFAMSTCGVISNLLFLLTSSLSACGQDMVYRVQALQSLWKVYDLVILKICSMY